MREQESRFTEWRLKPVVVTFAHDLLARAYQEDTGLAWPLLVDSSRQLYCRYGMLNASFRDVWGLRTWLAYARELFKGRALQAAQDDIYQRGGDVLIDPDGIVRLHHVGSGPADRPDAREIFSLIPAAGIS